MRKTSVSLRNVRKAYSSLQVIHGIDLDIKEGDFVVFVGPSGCGKSTLLRMIAGLEDVTEGEISIMGRDVTDADPSQRGIAMVFQSYALYPHMTVRDNLAFGLKMAKTTRAEIDRRVGAAAVILKIEPLLDRRPGQLSGGQRQRVAIGRAIVREPEVFLFDEPLSNLDAELRISMRIEIARLHRELGNTMIYVTHDQTEAMTLANQIVVLRNGRVEQVGSPRQIYDDPVNEFVAGFIGSPRMNFLKVSRLPDDRMQVAGRVLTIKAPFRQASNGDSLKLGIRPEHIVISGDASVGVWARVEFFEFLGGTRFLYCQLDDGQSLVVEHRADMDIGPGQILWLDFPDRHRRYFDIDGARLD